MNPDILLENELLLLDTIEPSSEQEERILDNVRRLLMYGHRNRNYSNCCGTYLYVVGQEDSLLGIGPPQFTYWYNIEKAKAPSLGSAVLLFDKAEDEEGSLNHVTCFLKQEDEEVHVFNQRGSGGSFGIDRVSKLKPGFGTHHDYFNVSLPD
jgi:hypothetical protein|tara:strand:- start:112 stop:567 length:456 start_codon:yes stop_codon:yes gene_type:complete